MLVGPVAVRVRDLLRQIAMEHEVHIISGKVARDHVHVFLSYRPHQDISTIVQWLKGISSRVLLQEFAHLRKKSDSKQENKHTGRLDLLAIPTQDEDSGKVSVPSFTRAIRKVQSPT